MGLNLGYVTSWPFFFVFVSYELTKGNNQLQCNGNKIWYMNRVSYLNVVCRTWSEVIEQGLWYVQVLGHMCEGVIRVGTYLLVPYKREREKKSMIIYDHPHSQYIFMNRLDEGVKHVLSIRFRYKIPVVVSETVEFLRKGTVNVLHYILERNIELHYNTFIWQLRNLSCQVMLD